MLRAFVLTRAKRGDNAERPPTYYQQTCDTSSPILPRFAVLKFRKENHEKHFCWKPQF